MSMRPKLRRLALGLATILGWRRAGWFIPYRYANRLPLPGAVPPYAVAAEILAAAEPLFLQTIDEADSHGEDLLRMAAAGQQEGRPTARFDQGWFPTLDAVVAYALVRRHRPRRIVEVGSGHSTRFLARALADAGLTSEIIAIDPAPRAAVDNLSNVRLLRQTVQQIAPEQWPALHPDDMLFIDSSHILMPGSDVDFLFNRILPRLPPGVRVHIHDIFLPDDYPAAWAWRNYNEQQAVVPLLTSGSWRPLFASHYVRTRMASRLAASVVARLPAAAAGYPASLWLQRMAR